MNASTRLTIALHVLTLLAAEPAGPLTSEYIAASVSTNPVVIRRVLGLLKRKGIVTSQPGIRGGWELSTKSDAITVLDVRRAVNEGSPFSMHSQQPNAACPIGRNIQRALGGVYAQAVQAMETELECTTIAMLLGSVQGAKHRAKRVRPVV